jgi:hypothetical protein
MTALILILGFLTITIGGGVLLRSSYKQGNLQETIIQKAMPAGQSASTTLMVQKAFGMEAPRTYLVLFLNNTEIRPGGGFIGSYALFNVNRGKPDIIKVEGTENLDNAAAEVGIDPPPALAKYLGIKKMQLRDSNWSPDFPTDARLALELYKSERGAEAEHIDGVIAVTPTLFEEILKITGPVKADGVEFTSENFTEKLEYEVEYGYKARGQDFSDRKKLLGDLSKALLPRLVTTSFTHWNDYLRLIAKMLNEKQIMLYSIYPDEQEHIISERWDGSVRTSTGDFLLWTDANLGALKTDVAIQRTLSYDISPTTSGKLVASATMHYHHTGGFTWRTTRYRDYVRIFVPAGSKIISVTGSTELTVNGVKNAKPAEGDENGKHWFGTYLAVEPGKQAALSFTYILPDNIKKNVDDGSYSLLVQKQSGTINTRLTLGLNFGKKLTTALPPESSEKFGDSNYDQVSDLREDRYFEIGIIK